MNFLLLLFVETLNENFGVIDELCFKQTNGTRYYYVSIFMFINHNTNILSYICMISGNISWNVVLRKTTTLFLCLIVSCHAIMCHVFCYIEYVCMWERCRKRILKCDLYAYIYMLNEWLNDYYNVGVPTLRDSL